MDAVGIGDILMMNHSKQISGLHLTQALLYFIIVVYVFRFLKINWQMHAVHNTFVIFLTTMTGTSLSYFNSYSIKDNIWHVFPVKHFLRHTLDVCWKVRGTDFLPRHDGGRVEWRKRKYIFVSTTWPPHTTAALKMKRVCAKPKEFLKLKCLTA